MDIASTPGRALVGRCCLLRIICVDVLQALNFHYLDDFQPGPLPEGIN
jgi:hypothetical protein